MFTHMFSYSSYVLFSIFFPFICLAGAIYVRFAKKVHFLDNCLSFAACMCVCGVAPAGSSLHFPPIWFCVSMQGPFMYDVFMCVCMSN